MGVLAFPPMPARLLRLRLLTILYRALLEMRDADEILWDESDFSRLALDEPPTGQQPFEEEDVPWPEIGPTLPTFGLRPWDSDASHRTLEPEIPSSAGVSIFGPQELIHPTTDARFFNESWHVLPFDAGSEVSNSIMHSDANTGVRLLGELLPEEQYQDTLNLGTQFPL